MNPVRARLERTGFRLLYRLVDLTYALGVATPKRSVAGTYWSYEPTNPHGGDPGLAALAALPTDATVVDVGAHVGEHAIPLARGTDRDVIAFEPNGESADRLARNARRSGLRVSDRDSGQRDDGADDATGAIDLRRAGLGDMDATLSFYRSTFSKLSAFDRDRATRWGAGIASVEAVPIGRLDDLVVGTDAGDERDDAVPPPDAVKIDVEGREGAVLRGAEHTIETYRPLLVVEVHSGGDDDTADHRDPLREWLTERGYEIEAIEDVWVCRG
ncbi:FkbM family methyltransferase [Halorubrum sp. DTA46]|uniref:FkbM family methyltransferase n=1 Tax=Halorubrum sp. DTA46 TaxID=3402162 RepID=UPI003AAA2FA6